MNKLIYIIASALIISISACKTTKEVTTEANKIDCSGTAYSYAADIKPILNQNCNGCHGPVKKRGGLDFTIDEVLYAEAKSGKVSCAINHAKGCEPMPQYNPKLDDETIKKIECWVNSGMAQ